MSVFKYHAFIYFMRPPPWYGTTVLWVFLRFRTTGFSTTFKKIVFNYKDAFDVYKPVQSREGWILLCIILCRTCNLTSFSPCLTGPVDWPLASRHKGPGFKSPGGGDICETGILLLALSRYNSTLNKEYNSRKIFLYISRAIDISAEHTVE